MDSSNSLRQFATTINDLLSEYIEFHNKHAKQTGTFKSLFKGLFTGINYAELNDEATSIYFKTTMKQNEIRELKESEFFIDLSKDQRDFFVKLTDYVDALAQSTFLLSEVVDLEYKRSQNMITLKFEEFKSKLKAYEESGKNRSNIGNQLNHLYKKLL